MNKELEQLKIERKRNWKKILKCIRGWNKLFNKRFLKDPNCKKKLRSKQEKYNVYLEAWLIANQRIKELENS
ncbi:hypothetical protein ACTS9E_15250 [Empedobacter brevis]